MIKTRIGQRARVISSGESCFRLIGICVEESDGSYMFEFPGWRHGHSGSYGDNRRTCWYLTDRDVEWFEDVITSITKVEVDMGCLETT